MKTQNKIMCGIFGCCLAIGLLVIFGYTGAADLDAVTVGELGKKLLEGMLVAMTGLAGVVLTVAIDEGAEE